MDNKEQLSYVEALEMERVKMLVFQRELPLSIDLVSRAIETYRQQQHLSESLSEETTSNSDDRGAVLEFIPITNNPTNMYASSPEDDRQDLNQQPYPSEKSDWLKSVQLWNQTPDDLANEPSKKESNATRKGCKNTTLEKCTESSSTHHIEDDQFERGGGISKKDNDKEESAKRKQRRCWSQELHRRFLHSLQQLGGAHVATPKQIRELMKVDGLTNDEVKSHLQKYRLHSRRPTLPPNQDNSGGAQAAQFVVVGGIWVPPSDHYPTMPSANTEENKVSLPLMRNGVYTSTAASVVQPHPWEPLNPRPQIIKMHKNSEGLGDALARYFSSSTSSSTRTTASPVC